MGHALSAVVMHAHADTGLFVYELRTGMQRVAAAWGSGSGLWRGCLLTRQRVTAGVLVLRRDCTAQPVFPCGLCQSSGVYGWCVRTQRANHTAPPARPAPRL